MDETFDDNQAPKVVRISLDELQAEFRKAEEEKKEELMQQDMQALQQLFEDFAKLSPEDKKAVADYFLRKK